MSYTSFEVLCADIGNLLDKNKYLFDNYGPESKRSSSEKEYEVWEKFVGGDILPNNDKIVEILNLNKALYEDEPDIVYLVDKFRKHAASYKAFRENPNEEHGENLFPNDFSELINKWRKNEP